MAAQNKLFQRLIWLIDTIYSAGHITRDEINQRWANAFYNDTHEKEYGERNFHRHKEMIYTMFGIEIVCNRTTKEYSIVNLGDAQGKDVRAWLINTFAINNMVNIAGDMKDRIIFESIPEGTRYLSSIVSAMKEERLLRIVYQRFDRAEPHAFSVAPYCLKVFKRRWYMIGKPQDHPEETHPRVYALDRIKEMSPTEDTYHMPKDFKADKFFESHFGIDRRITEPAHIKIKIAAADANYIRTLPIHGSQIETEQNDTYSIFCFHIAPTYDFVQELRKYGPCLEILEPAYLREQFITDYQTALDNYRK